VFPSFFLFFRLLAASAGSLNGMGSKSLGNLGVRQGLRVCVCVCVCACVHWVRERGRALAWMFIHLVFGCVCKRKLVHKSREVCVY